MSHRMLQHDATDSGSYWPSCTAGQVLLQPPQVPPRIRRYNSPMEEQMEMLTRKFHSCLAMLIRLGFSDTEARLSLLRNRFDLEATAMELYHAAFIRKLRRASQTRAELGYSRSDVYKCGHKCLQKYRPYLPSLGELSEPVGDENF